MKINAHSLGTALLIAIAATSASCKKSKPNPIDHAGHDIAILEALSAEKSLQALGYTDTPKQGLPSFIGSSFQQHWQLINFRQFIVTDSEAIHQNPLTNWVHGKHHFTTRIPTSYISPAGPDTFLAAGYERDGKLSIQRWSLSPTSGSITITPSPPGLPHSLTPKALTATSLLSFSDDTKFVSGVLDIEQDYLITATRQAGLTSLTKHNLTGPSITSSEPLLNSTQHPELNETLSIQQFFHTSLGRVIDVRCYTAGSTPGPTALRITFLDSNEDGLFDSEPIIGDDAHFQHLGIDDFPQWLPYYME